MTELTGRSVSNGIAIGKIKLLDSEELVIRRKVSDVDAERARFFKALEVAGEEISRMTQDADCTVAEIFEAHKMLLEDPAFLEAVEIKISREQVNAEYAVAVCGDNFAIMFSNMDDETFKAKSLDIKDISNNLIRILKGKTSCSEATACGDIASLSEAASCDDKAILVARELTPSQLMRYGLEKIDGLVSESGSYNSHVSIIARSLGVPALVGISINDIEAGEKDGLAAGGVATSGVIVDGDEGKLIIGADGELISEYKEKLGMSGLDNKGIRSMNIPADVCVNVSSLEDVKHACELDADGIGLVRTELLWSANAEEPSEEEQFETYKTILQSMNGKTVVIRTFDFGSDKKADFLLLPEEKNPALGIRGVRLYWTHPKLLKTQLRALYRASTYGQLEIMYPMITSLEEVEKLKTISKSVRDELLSEGVEISEAKEGIMIETPAAALISDRLAKYVDFFSIGTNDLTQYTLGIDRENQDYDECLNPAHPAVWSLITLTVYNAKEAGIPVSVCGEMAADLSWTERLVELGVDKLSVGWQAI